MELSERRRFPKPTFQDVEKAFVVAKSSLHVCQVANPMDGNRGTDEAAPRVCEALLVAARVVERRNDIARAEKKILGAYSYEVYGRLCPHGVALDSAHLGDFLTAEWGEPLLVKDPSGGRERLTGKPGIICFKSIPGQTGTKSRIDLWNGKRCLGDSEHWNAGDIRFWELPAAAGAADGETGGGFISDERPDTSWLDKPKQIIKEIAEEVEETVDEILDGMYAMAEKAKEEIDVLAHKVADLFGGDVAEAPLKSRARVLEKAESDYDGDVRRVKDLARNTIVVPAGKELDALQKLRELNPAITAKEIVIVDGAKDPCGYSGIKVLAPTSSGMRGEIQINSPQMIFAKEKPADAARILGADKHAAMAAKPGMPEAGKGHVLYEQFRTAKDPVEKAKVAEQSRAYYDAVRAAGAS